ncbi:MAG: hypothetical protein ACI9S8_002026 [Chlamydiales bacterium]|jgi:hypothetical protein
MSFGFGTVGAPTTKKNYLDFLRPAAMVDASAIFKKIQSISGADPIDALNIAATVSDSITSTKGSEIDQIWDKIEKTLYRRKTLKVNAKTPEGKLNTALGLIYSSIESIDSGNNINFLRSVSNMVNGVKNHINSRFLGKFEGSSRRTLQRSMDTIDGYLKRVIVRFNDRIEAGEIGGTAIEL